jgi:hypothetical protein
MVELTIFGLLLGSALSLHFTRRCRARVLCAAAFARLPHTAMLHQRRAWPLLTS